MAPMDLTVAFVRGTHGLSGEFKVESASGRYEHIAQLKEVALRLKGQTTLYKVERVEGSDNAFYMKLAGVDSPEAAKKLNGAELRVSRDKALQPKEGEWLIEDLKNCSLVYCENGLANGAPVVIGSITDVLEGGAGDLLEVVLSESCSLLDDSVKKTSSGKPRTVLVPFNDTHVGKVDVEGKTVQLTHLWILE